MTRHAAAFDSTVGPVRLHARRVALGATLFALVVYLAACLTADLVVIGHLYRAIDSRLSSRLRTLSNEFPLGLSSLHAARLPIPSAGADGDLDDAPILGWFVANGSPIAQRLVTGSPALPRKYFRVSQPVGVRLGQRGFRLDGVTTATGRFLVATSTQDVGSIRATLLLIEGVLAPIILLVLFLAATVIGRRAATPIERARQRQLEFTADASHELRTPLSVIEAEVGLALSSHRTAVAYRSALERVLSESKRLRSIVDDLLWLARLDSLPANPPREVVDMASLARTCVARFGAIAAQRGLTISLSDLVEYPPLVLAPAEWLDRLVSVLLDNACRYANRSGRVEVSVCATDERVTLRVDDDGPGIAVAEREHILQRFHRASSVPGGAGLGLSIANAIVQATNGSWSVTTAPLGGARIEASWSRVRVDDGYDRSSDEDQLLAALPPGIEGGEAPELLAGDNPYMPFRVPNPYVSNANPRRRERRRFMWP